MITKLKLGKSKIQIIENKRIKVKEILKKKNLSKYKKIPEAIKLIDNTVGIKNEQSSLYKTE